MINIIVKQTFLSKIRDNVNYAINDKTIAALATILSLVGIYYALIHGTILAYGDAESHINIAKRVIDSITPGMAQLGGIWLPIPHLLMVPFVKLEFLYRTGLAGSIVSGGAYIFSSFFLFKIIYFLTKNKLASFVGFLVYATNPNLLYLQATPLTEMVLICFFIMSTYYFIRFIFISLQIEMEHVKRTDSEYVYLILAAFFGFCATLTRYDGWFLVLVEAAIVGLVYLPATKLLYKYPGDAKKQLATLFEQKFYIAEKKRYAKFSGMVILFSSLAFFGVALWLLWDFLILGDPLYFTNSQYSSKAQQQVWLARGQLPSYHNIVSAFQYFFVDSMSLTGIIVFVVSIIGMIYFLIKYKKLPYFLLTIVFLVPFIFNVITLYMGQSIIFIPELTPPDFEWKIFNVRYGILMLPAVATFFALLFYLSKNTTRVFLIFLFVLQIGLYTSGYSKVMAVRDGIEGLSSAKKPDAEYWMAAHYDNGMVLLDDYARSMSIIRSGIPMQSVIYVGNKPYWQESFITPEKYATWIIMQKDDAVWSTLYNNPTNLARVYKYFRKEYTSNNIIIFRRNEEPAPQ